MSDEYEGPAPPTGTTPGSEQEIGDDESDYGGAGAPDPEDFPGEEGAERGPREEDEDQGV